MRAVSEGPDGYEADPLEVVVRWRRREALAAGLTRVEARIWAEAVEEYEVGELRRLIELGCPPEQLAKILL